jgi:CRP-like cAMP-binding protein
MATALLRDALITHPFLAGLPADDIDKLAEICFEKSFGEDEILFREADPSGFFYLLLSGTVALEITAPGRVIRIQTITAGEELGWSSMMDEGRKQFQARALEPVRALAFDGGKLRRLCDADFAFGYDVLKRLLVVVSERLQNTRLQLLDIFSKKGGVIK